MFLTLGKTMVNVFFESEHSIISLFAFKVSQAKERLSTVQKEGPGSE